MRNLARAGLALALAAAVQTAAARDFFEGQVWAYKARPGEEASRILINKVESDPKVGEIFLISISGLRLKDKNSPSGVRTELPFMPVTKASLEASCTNRIATMPPNSAFEAGYAEWKPAFVSGKAGVFGNPIAEIVGIVEKGLNR